MITNEDAHIATVATTAARGRVCATVGLLGAEGLGRVTPFRLDPLRMKNKRMFMSNNSEMLYGEGVFDLTRLRTFRAVVAEGSVNGAAANLGYTPSAVSQQIHALQRETGLDLFERHGRGIVPTAIGRRFADEAEPLLVQATRLRELAADLRVGRTGSLTVTHISSVGAAWIPSVAATLSREFPEVRLDLRLWELTQGAGEETDVEIYVERGGSDPAPPKNRESHDIEELLTEPYVVVLPADHRLAGREEIALAELFSENWVDNDVAGGLCRQIVLDACATRGFTPSFALQTQSDGAAVAFVEAGAGITVLSELGFLTSRAETQKVAVATLIDPTPTRTVMVRTKKHLANNPAVRRLLELLRDSAAGQRPLKTPVS